MWGQPSWIVRSGGGEVYATLCFRKFNFKGRSNGKLLIDARTQTLNYSEWNCILFFVLLSGTHGGQNEALALL